MRFPHHQNNLLRNERRPVRRNDGMRNQETASSPSHFRWSLFIKEPQPNKKETNENRPNHRSMEEQSPSIAHFSERQPTSLPSPADFHRQFHFWKNYFATLFEFNELTIRQQNSRTLNLEKFIFNFLKRKLIGPSNYDHEDHTFRDPIFAAQI